MVVFSAPHYADVVANLNHDVTCFRPVSAPHRIDEIKPTRLAGGGVAANSTCKLCERNVASYHCRTCQEEGRVAVMCLSCNTERHKLMHGVTNSSFETDDDKDALSFLEACFIRNPGSNIPDQTERQRPTPSELMKMAFVSSSLSPHTSDTGCRCGCHWKSP